MIKKVDDFFNKLVSELGKTYFPTVKYYRDDENCSKMHYFVELFNNGACTYGSLVNKLSKVCKDSETNIEIIVDKYLTK